MKTTNRAVFGALFGAELYLLQVPTDYQFCAKCRGLYSDAHQGGHYAPSGEYYCSPWCYAEVATWADYFAMKRADLAKKLPSLRSEKQAAVLQALGLDASAHAAKAIGFRRGEL